MAKDGPRIEILRRRSPGTVYATTKSRRATTSKLELRKHDPVVRRHAPFHEIQA